MRAFERTRDIARHRVFLDELRERQRFFALLAQSSTLAELARAGCLENATEAWSMWAGYLNNEPGARVQQLLARHHVPLVALHASGHAAPADLRTLAASVGQARRRSHALRPQLFAGRFALLRRDG